MSKPHSVEMWRRILDERPDPQKAADRILGDLIGYQHSSVYREADAKNLANALAAWVLLEKENMAAIS